MSEITAYWSARYNDFVSGQCSRHANEVFPTSEQGRAAVKTGWVNIKFAKPYEGGKTNPV